MNWNHVPKELSHDMREDCAINLISASNDYVNENDCTILKMYGPGIEQKAKVNQVPIAAVPYTTKLEVYWTSLDE